MGKSRRAKPRPASPAPRATKPEPGAGFRTGALALLLVVLAARPLVQESYQSAQLGIAPALLPSYVLSDRRADIPGTAAFSNLLLLEPGPARPITITVPAQSTIERRAVTPAGLPGRDHWETGRWTITVPIVQSSPDVSLAIGVARADATGAPQEPQAFSNEQTLDRPGDYVYGLGPVAWSRGRFDDRILLTYRFTNSTDQDRAVTLETNGRVTTPAPYVASLPGPVLTVIFDAMILIAGLLFALSTLRSKGRIYRMTGAEIGMGVLLLALVVSGFAAGNRRVALLASVDFACLLLLMVLLAQLLRRRWQIRLTLCVITASGVVAAARCLEQVTVELDETIRLYAQAEQDTWTQQGRALDDPIVQLFRARLLARDPTAYMTHPNIAAGHLMLAAFAAAALAAAKLAGPRRKFARFFGVLTASLAAFMVVAVVLTHSRGAVVAGVAATTACVGFVMLRRPLARRRRAALVLAWGGVLVAALATVTWGRLAGGLPGSSLTFRWQYWSTAGRMIHEHLAGVGSGHFGRNYLQYKPVTSPDEITNAHNLFVHAAAEWGVVGLAGLLAILVGVSIVLTRPRLAEPATEPDPRAGRALSYAIGLTLAIVAFRAVAEFRIELAFLIVTLALPTLIFPLTMVIGALESDRLDRFEDTALPLGRWILCAGLVAFLLHNVISFSLYVPGAATPFFAVAAVAIALASSRSTDPPTATTSRVRLALPVGAGAALTVFGLVVFRPVMNSCIALVQARAAAPYGTPSDDPKEHPAAERFAAAMRADPLDPTPASDWAQWLVEFRYRDPDAARAAFTKAMSLLDTAIERDHGRIALHRQRVRTLHSAYQALNDTDALRQAVAEADKVVAMYPESPRDHLNLARLCDDLYTINPESALAGKARSAYVRALKLDAARPGPEVRRFPADDRQHAIARVQALDAATPR